jgi:hypothetical protein
MLLDYMNCTVRLRPVRDELLISFYLYVLLLCTHTHTQRKSPNLFTEREKNHKEMKYNHSRTDYLQ